MISADHIFPPCCRLYPVGRLGVSGMLRVDGNRSAFSSSLFLLTRMCFSLYSHLQLSCFFLFLFVVLFDASGFVFSYMYMQHTCINSVAVGVI